MARKMVCFDCGNRKVRVTGSLLCVGCFKLFSKKMKTRMVKT